VTYRYLAQCYIARGDREQARDAVTRSMATGALKEQNADWAYGQAMLAALEDDDREALRWLALAADRGYQDTDWLSRDGAFASLRGDPEFERIAAVVLDRQFFRN